MYSLVVFSVDVGRRREPPQPYPRPSYDRYPAPEPTPAPYHRPGYDRYPAPTPAPYYHAPSPEPYYERPQYQPYPPADPGK